MKFISDMDGNHPMFHSMCIWSICRFYPRPSLCDWWMHPYKAWKNERYLCQSHERGLLWCWNRAETSVVARRELCEQINHNWRRRSIRCKSIRIIGAQGLAELVKIFNPHANTSLRLLKDAYKYHESLKNSNYQQNCTSRTEQLAFWSLEYLLRIFQSKSQQYSAYGSDYPQFTHPYTTSLTPIDLWLWPTEVANFLGLDLSMQDASPED